MKITLLRKCFKYAHTITGDWINFESGLDCQSPKQFLTRLHSCTTFFIFLDIKLDACSFTKNEPLDRYFLSILTGISLGNCKSCYL